MYNIYIYIYVCMYVCVFIDILEQNFLTLLCYFRPENVPRLFDLVKAKEDKFLTAFYFALRDTLVAKDLDQATRIGLQVSEYSVNVIWEVSYSDDYYRGVLVIVL